MLGFHAQTRQAQSDKIEAQKPFRACANGTSLRRLCLTLDTAPARHLYSTDAHTLQKLVGSSTVSSKLLSTVSSKLQVATATICQIESASYPPEASRTLRGPQRMTLLALPE